MGYRVGVFIVVAVLGSAIQQHLPHAFHVHAFEVGLKTFLEFGQGDRLVLEHQLLDGGQ